MAAEGCVPLLPLRGDFRQYKHGLRHYSVLLDEQGVMVGGSGKEVVLRATDLVGCVCQQGQQEGVSAYFTLLYYPLVEKKGRVRQSMCFEVAEKDTLQGNLEIANAWRNAVHHIIRTQGSPKSHIDHSKKLLLFINPNSGSGRALQTYRKQVSGVLAEGAVAHEVLVTERANHALEVVRNLDLTQYSGLVILSGDGLLYEVYNGLLARPDWEEAIQFPIGIIPGGSGNGLARSVAHWLNEPYMANPVLVSTLNMVYGHLSPMDLVMIETAEKRILSFLSVGFGLISDIDIESERLRIIGETRFALWAVARCANLRKYQATISFKRVGGITSSPTQTTSAAPHLQRSQTLQERVDVTTSTTRQLARSKSIQPQEPQDYEGGLDLSPSLVKVEDDTQAQSSLEEAQEVKEPVQQQQETRQITSLPPLDQPVPDDWETIKDEFIMVYCSLHSHISSDVFIAPSSTPDDGCLWMMLLRRSCPKTTVAKLLLGLDGRHLRLPGVEIVPVEALRIAPGSTDKGYLTVDGEVIPWTPLQCQVMQKMGCIITR